MARRILAIAVLLLMSTAVSGCEYVFGEQEAAVDLYNPATRDHVLCGGRVHYDVPSFGDVSAQDRCIAVYMGRGYRVVGQIEPD
jgi:hypothetical protein